MTNVAFDTHRYVKRLTAAGMPKNQAEVIADEQRSLIEDQLATKHDIKELEAAIKALEVNTRRDMKELEANTRRDIKELEANTQRDIKEQQVAIKTLETNTRRDIKALEAAIREQQATIKTLERDIKALDTNNQQKFKELEVAIKAQEAAIKAMEISRPRDLKELEQRITIRLGMMMTAAILAVSALVTIF